MMRRRLLLGLTLALNLDATACGSEKTPSASAPRRGEGASLPEGGTFTRAALLEAFGACALTHTKTFREDAEALARAANQAADAPSPSTRQETRDAWTRAMATWQRVEVMQFGPAGTGTLPGGRSLRDTLYTWPLTGRCAVDQTIADETYASGRFADELPVKRGLLAAEYLLFHEGADNGCAANVEPNASGAWAALGDEELARRKVQYVRVVAEDIAARARTLDDAWDPGKGNFLFEFTHAGAGSRTYRSDSVAFNAVSDALFYLDYATKDLKLGRPLGLSGCASATCPDAVESPFAGASKAHLRQNLLGFRALYAGCADDGDGLGFDDYLFALGATELSRELRQAVDAALAAVDALEGADLARSLASEPERVRVVYDAVKRVTDLLKSQFLSVLDLELPVRVEGDND